MVMKNKPLSPGLVSLAATVFASSLLLSHPASAADGSVLTTIENQVVAAAKGWETTVAQAAKSLFWILAGIEVGIAAVW
ncbi:hypothetical protein ABTL60_19305, partial [Acinetobacter baumannii]